MKIILKIENIITLKGISASVGIALGPIFIIENEKPLVVIKQKCSSVEVEIDKLTSSLSAAQAKVLGQKSAMVNTLSSKELELYDAYLEILKDPELKANTIDYIKEEKCNVDFALQQITSVYIYDLEALDDPYLRARAEDIRMLNRMLVNSIQGRVEPDIVLTSPSILVAESLSTNQLAAINAKQILGVVTAKGGKTDHIAILLKSMGIPALVGIGKSISTLKKESYLIIDCNQGMLIVNPIQEIVLQYELLKEKQIFDFERQIKLSHSKATTLSGKELSVCANVGAIEDMQKAFQFGADGVGLFRTEMCFLESKNFPTEESHFQKYTSILKEFPKALHTIRLLDFGSDKPLVYLKNKIEKNPALGSRALRLGFEYYKELLKPQLRALLRLSQHYNLQLLCPMIADIDDLIEIKAKINLEYDQLINEGVEIRKVPSIGIMVEIPNIILQPKAIVKEADFFSVGTNDLAQFLMAADRTNNRVAHYLTRAKESLMFLIDNFTKVAHEEGKKVSVCGELASDKECLSTFIRIGVDSLSMPPNLIPIIKEAIRNSP